jgi:dTMP kinase
MSGKFITLEGGEGAGKSTCMAAVMAVLAQHDLEHIQTREPGGTRLSEALRELLLDPLVGDVSPQAELLMVFAARTQHLNELIRPALERGCWVICDRFTDASFAYQGGGRGLDKAAIGWLEQWVHAGLSPDLTVLLDVKPEVGLARATANRSADRFEREELDFYSRVQQAYLERAAKDPGRFQVIDAGQDLEQVSAEVTKVVTRFVEDSTC